MCEVNEYDMVPVTKLVTYILMLISEKEKDKNVKMLKC